MITIRGRAARRFAAALSAAAFLTACSDNNPFQQTGGGGGGTGGGGAESAQRDSVRPSVTIERPNAQTPTVAVGDSLFVVTKVRDNAGLARVELEGFAIRGNANLGTDVRVSRFSRKTVELGGAGRVVADTTLTRYLIAAPDTLPEEGVYVVVIATDTAGNSSADTARVNLGGPKVAIRAPAPGTTFTAGTNIPVRIVAEDLRDLIVSFTVRGTGAFTASPHKVTLPSPLAKVDTTVSIAIPASAPQGSFRIEASALSGSTQEGTAVPVDVSVLAAAADVTAPKATFSTEVPARVEQPDSFSVTVTGVDDNRVAAIGATVLAFRRNGTSRTALATLAGEAAAASATFRFSIAQLGLSPLDTASLDFEVTAWAVDAAGNCGAAIAPNSPQSLACVAGAGGVRTTSTPGRLLQSFLARGTTVPPPNPGDRIADLVADNQRVYLANYSRNRVDLLPVGALSYGTPVRVGSQPWGLSIGRFGDTLFVANSGGTNISLIPLGGSPLAEAEGERIFTRNERLYSVEVSFRTREVGKVVEYDYSDRPQFMGQASNGLLVYSTRPTTAAKDGTVRIYDRTKRRSEIFIGYVGRHTSDRAIVVNADSAFRTADNRLLVCPRRRHGDTLYPQCIVGDPWEVEDALRAMRALPATPQGGRWDTRVDIGADITEVGLSDTTFVATSRDRRFVAVGEGARDLARIPLFEASGDSLLLRGDVRDLIGNAAEKVIGLGLNGDGSLGVARGSEAYFFNSALRLQGRVESGTPTGGVAMHPANVGYPNGSQRLSFVSGIDAAGPYVDVIDTFNFFRVKRVYLRDPVVGAIAVAPRASFDPADVVLRLYALTPKGVLSLTVTTADLAR